MTTRPGPEGRRVAWRWSGFVRGAALGAPAAWVALDDLQLGAVFALGLVPALSLPLPPRRRERVRVALVGALTAVSIVVGGLLAVRPPAAVVGIFLIAVLAARGAATRPRLALLLYLCLPVTAVAFSYPGLATAAELAAVMVAGSLWAVGVGLVWSVPPSVAEAPSGSLPAIPHLVSFGYRAGLAGATCTAVGFAADLEHVGWAPAAALLVMRPAGRVQRMRTWNRVADVVAGSVVAIALVTLDAPPWVPALTILVGVMVATAVAGSRWYLLPFFSTFFVFLLLLADDPGAASARFWERVTETLLGVAVAGVFGLALPALGSWLRTRRDRSTRAGVR